MVWNVKFPFHIFITKIQWPTLKIHFLCLSYVIQFPPYFCPPFSSALQICRRKMHFFFFHVIFLQFHPCCFCSFSEFSFLQYSTNYHQLYISHFTFLLHKTTLSTCTPITFLSSALHVFPLLNSVPHIWWVILIPVLYISSVCPFYIGFVSFPYNIYIPYTSLVLQLMSKVFH